MPKTLPAEAVAVLLLGGHARLRAYFRSRKMRLEHEFYRCPSKADHRASELNDALCVLCHDRGVVHLSKGDLKPGTGAREVDDDLLYSVWNKGLP